MTGSIDAIVPDLPSNWDPNSIFEVRSYLLIIFWLTPYYLVLSCMILYKRDYAWHMPKSSLCSLYSLFDFQVVDYSLTVEGMPESVHPGLLHSDSFSCKSIFECFPLARKRNLKVFVYFHLCNTTCRNLLIYPSIYSQDELNETENGAFHLICITRKFPPLRKVGTFLCFPHWF